jgi:hypothetical protein
MPNTPSVPGISPKLLKIERVVWLAPRRLVFSDGGEIGGTSPCSTCLHELCYIGLWLKKNFAGRVELLPDWSH